MVGVLVDLYFLCESRVYSDGKLSVQRFVIFIIYNGGGGGGGNEWWVYFYIFKKLSVQSQMEVECAE